LEIAVERHEQDDPLASCIQEKEILTALAGSNEGEWNETHCGTRMIPSLTREFWTSKQRKAHKLHEVSYRACYKPQLPRLFIENLTKDGDLVYDPFSGRGTTALEAALLGRKAAANDINPLSRILLEPRLAPPTIKDIAVRLSEIPRDSAEILDLSQFYHPETEREIRSLRAWCIKRQKDGTLDDLDRWIRMVAITRLTGHSKGFFSVRTLPPNQAVTRESQERLNRKHGLTPQYKDTHALILKKSLSMLGSTNKNEHHRLSVANEDAMLLAGDASVTPELASDSVQLTVTSPPFLDVVKYAQDNWLRCWFCGLDAKEIGKGITMSKTVPEWSSVMGKVFQELFRVTKPGGYVAFEVGEVRKGKVRLAEEAQRKLALQMGFNEGNPES